MSVHVRLRWGKIMKNNTWSTSFQGLYHLLYCIALYLCFATIRTNIVSLIGITLANGILCNAWPKQYITRIFEILTDLSKGEWFFVVNWVKSVGRYHPRSILFSDGVRGQTIHIHLHVSANFLVRQKLTWDDLKQHRSSLLPPFPLKQCVCRLSLAYLNRALGCNNAIYRRFCEGIELFVIATHKVRL